MQLNPRISWYVLTCYTDKTAGVLVDCEIVFRSSCWMQKKPCGCWWKVFTETWVDVTKSWCLWSGSFDIMPRNVSFVHSLVVIILDIDSNPGDYKHVDVFLARFLCEDRVEREGSMGLLIVSERLKFSKLVLSSPLRGLHWPMCACLNRRSPLNGLIICLVKQYIPPSLTSIVVI